MTPQRFWEKVAVGEPDACWEWQSFRHAKTGYGRWHPGKYARSVSTHREAWRLTHGEIPKGLCVLHRCDNRPCCNPAHLWLGTKTENNADMVAKGRNQPPRSRIIGESNRNAKMTDSAVLSARAQYAGGVGIRPLAKIYGIGRNTMRRILRGQKWKHVA